MDGICGLKLWPKKLPSIMDQLSTPEVPVLLSQTSAETGNNDGNYCLVETHLKISEIKEEEEEIWDDGQTQQVIFPSIEGVKSERDQPETQVSYELQPVSSDGSAAQSESNGSDEEWSRSEGARTKMKRRKVKVLRRQNGGGKQKGPAALPDGDSSSVKSEKERSTCPICGKHFKCIRPFMNHIKRHRQKSESVEELLTHLQSALNKRLFCEVCGKKFTNTRCLQLHSKIQTGVKDFKCQDCGRAFVQKEQLVVHMRTHSGERPFQCNVCGKAFTQKHHLISHCRKHTGERP